MLVTKKHFGSIYVDIECIRMNLLVMNEYNFFLSHYLNYLISTVGITWWGAMLDAHLVIHISPFWTIGSTTKNCSSNFFKDVNHLTLFSLMQPCNDTHTLSLLLRWYDQEIECLSVMTNCSPSSHFSSSENFLVGHYPYTISAEFFWETTVLDKIVKTTD